jgi:hypothetical protein
VLAQPLGRLLGATCQCVVLSAVHQPKTACRYKQKMNTQYYDKLKHRKSEAKRSFA